MEWNQNITLLLRGSAQRLILGNCFKNNIELFDSEMKRIAATQIKDVKCGLLHNDYIYFGGGNGITIVEEQTLQEV